MRPLPRLIPLVLLLGCVQPTGPQPVLVNEFVGRDEIMVSWPEGASVSRVNQLARTVCGLEGRHAIGLSTQSVDGQRVRVYRCEERVRLVGERWPVPPAN